MKRRYIYIIYVAVWLSMLTSCVTSTKVNYFQEPNDNIPAYVDTLDYQEYTIRQGDRLYIQVHTFDEKMNQLFNGGTSQNNQIIMQGGNMNGGGNSDLYSYIVNDSGYIKFPTLGMVKAQELSTRELKRDLEKRLSGMIVTRGEMANISVDVYVIQRYYSVIGVNMSGRYPITKEKITIFEALAQCGDISDFGDRHRVQIIRQIGDSTTVKTFDVRSKDIVNSEFYYIEPNDVIYIRKMRGESFGLNSASAAISTVATTISFGVFIYTLVDRFIITPINKNSSK